MKPTLSAWVAALSIALLLGACTSNKPVRPKGIYLAEPLADSTVQAAPAGTDTRLLVDGLVGQVNGQPVYASTVIDKELATSLERIGQELPRLAFREKAFELIDLKLRAIVGRRLMLGEAERNLTAQDEMTVRNILRDARERLIAQHGGGVLSRAQANLQRDDGMTLDQKLEEIRQDVIIRKHVNEAIQSKVSVSIRDMERYYHDRNEQFRPPQGRTFRLIIADRPGDAEAIDGLLAEGVPFAEVAATDRNQYRRDEGGLHNKVPITSDTPFAEVVAPLNEAAAALKVDEHSPRLEINRRYYWVYLDAESRGQGKSFQEAQREILRILENDQRTRLVEQYYDELLRTGATDPLPRMVEQVVEVAMNRYARPR